MFVAVGETMVQCSQIDVIEGLRGTPSGSEFAFTVKLRDGTKITAHYDDEIHASDCRDEVIKQCMGEV